MFEYKNVLNGRDLVNVRQDSPELEKLFSSADASAFPSRNELRDALYKSADDLEQGRANPPSGQPENTRVFYARDFRSTGDAILNVADEQYRSTLRVIVGNDEVLPGGGGFEPLDKNPLHRICRNVQKPHSSRLHAAPYKSLWGQFKRRYPASAR